MISVQMVSPEVPTGRKLDFSRPKIMKKTAGASEEEANKSRCVCCCLVFTGCACCTCKSCHLNCSECMKKCCDECSEEKGQKWEHLLGCISCLAKCFKGEAGEDK